VQIFPLQDKHANGIFALKMSNLVHCIKAFSFVLKREYRYDLRALMEGISVCTTSMVLVGAWQLCPLWKRAEKRKWVWNDV